MTRSSRRRPTLVGLLAVLAGAVLLSGCTGIPDSSAPEVIRSIPQTTEPVVGPQVTPDPTAAPSDVVFNFITTGKDAEAGHSAARQFLTTGAARRWQDNQTVILDQTAVGVPTTSGSTATVVMTGRRVGGIDATGVFTPTPERMGTGDEEKFTYGLIKVGQFWRIDTLPPGVVINAAAFVDYFRQRTLYFFDPTGRLLVPDLRYSPLQGQPLASWLLAELLAGPRPELAQTVQNEVPDQVGKPSVQVGDPTTIEIPGTGNLDSVGLNKLAAQLAYTLGRVPFGYAGTQLQLTDSGKPVRIPQSGSTQFSVSNFPAVNPEPAPSGNTGYAIRDGAVIDHNGTPVTGLLGQTSRDFASVALRRSGSQALLVAGLTTGGELFVGDDQKITSISLPQPATSRPDWRPNAEDDAWLGAGSRGGVYRVTAGEPATPVSMSGQVGGLPAAPVVALRFSPDGYRVALVIRSTTGVGTVWLGSVVTSGPDIRVDSLEPITPPALSVSDVAWADPTRLLLVAAQPGGESQVWQLFCDGSMLTPVSNSGLPGPPTAIAAAVGQPPVVSAGGSIYRREQHSWTGNSDSGSAVTGTNPVYAQ